MPIQDEVALPANPLATFTSDYAHAVLHLAWDRNKATRERTLLFAWVELLPSEVPPPNDDGETEMPLGSKSDHCINVRHAVLTAEQALAWYLRCRQGSAVLPESDGRLPSPEDPAARQMRLGELGEEPPWPNLVCVKDREAVLPFSPAWHVCPRAHHLVPLADFDLKRLWSKAQEQKEAIRVLRERLHFELDQYPEYWGSVHLVAPNPVFRKLEVRRQPGGTKARSAVLFRFRPRPGKSIDSLELSVKEDRPSGTSALRRVPVHQPTVRLIFDHATDLHSETVYDEDRGLLFASGKGIFLDSFQVGLSIGPVRTRVVQVPGDKAYEVVLQSPPATHVSVGVADQQRPQGRPRMRAAQLAHQARARAGGQRWFSGALEEAKRTLRELLYEARREVLIVDPYFAHEELFDFALAVGKIDVPISVLTSAEVLKNDAAPGVEKGDVLLAQVRHVASQTHGSTIAIRVMEGSRPPVHDRFFVIDDRVWLLGSSLNEFGSRGTMMVALPDPAPIRKKLFEARDAAEDLAEWVEGRKERRNGSAAGMKR